MPNQTFDHISVIEASDKRPASMGNPIARNWGPQSMLYLKGRYGRRYASSDSEEQYYKLDLDDLNAVMKNYQHSAPQKFLNIRRK
ncbi:spexin prohormone 2-like isoform X2 [Podarcis raffonei]|uniref:spexin prohormone 2-like isoform X2 n=1 Tax=Podarcis raffonei TaxID=65483 RepID=UPI0023299942|nr:spexin prohormone 2-like isoform X2 [Podarcis raffonei]